MNFLILHVLFSASFTLIIKWSQRKKYDSITIGMINYIVAALAIFPWFYLNSSADGIDPKAVLIGGVMGLGYVTAFFFVIFTIRHVGAASTSVISMLSMIVPISFGIFLWHESPNTIQFCGIGLALVALSLVGGKTDEVESKNRPWYTPAIAIIFFTLCGTNRLCQETFKHICSENHQAQLPTYLFSAFAIASVPSIVILIYRALPHKRKENSERAPRYRINELLTGACLGIANVTQLMFILLALKALEGYIVFPVGSAGSLAVTTFVATTMLKEKQTKWTYIGIGVAILAIILLRI